MPARLSLAAAAALVPAVGATLLAGPARAQEPIVGVSQAEASALELEVVVPIPAELGGTQTVQVTIAATEASAGDGSGAASAVPLAATAPIVGQVALGGGSTTAGAEPDAGAVAAPRVPGVVEAEVLGHATAASPTASSADASVLHVRVIPLGDLEVWLLRSSATAGSDPSAHTDAVAIRVADRFLHLLHSSADGTTVVSTILLNDELAPLADGLDGAAGELCPVEQIPGLRLGCLEVTGAEATVLTAVLSELGGGQVPGLDLSAVLDAFAARAEGSTAATPAVPPSASPQDDRAEAHAVAQDAARPAAVAGAALARTGVSLASAAVGLLVLATGLALLVLRDRVRSRRTGDLALPAG
jgi:hypothetical protein